MVDRDGLENRCACKRTVGSNPTPSAITYRNNGLRTPGWAPEKAMNRGLFHTKLLTADRRLRAVLVSLSPVVSKAPDFAILVRNFKCLILLGYSAQEIRTFRIPLVGARGTEIESRR